MRRIGLLVAFLVAGCTELTTPARTAFYEWRILVSKSGPGVDTLSFHWPRQQLPLRVWVANDDALRPHVATAVGRWEDAFLYGEFRGTLVGDSTTADIIIRNEIPDGGLGLSRMRLEGFAPGCSGVTIIDTVSAHVLKLPVHSYVWPNASADAPGVDDCYRITMTHEFGHALGLFIHSPNSADVMYSNPSLDGISDHDRQTVEALYHSQVTMTLDHPR
jgi:predicted Zn-dependent protease